MRLPGMRQFRSAEAEPDTWRGARRIAVLSAAGGAGASTLCALLAREIRGSIGGRARDVGIIDNAQPTRSPWSTWITLGLDTGLGDQGTSELCGVRPGPGSYPVATMQRACGAIRGLPGVAVLAATSPACDFDLEAASASFAAAVVDIAFNPYPETADFLNDFDGDVLLTIEGTADGVSAGHAALRSWMDLGLPPKRIRPVVVGAPGNPSARVMSRLALMDPGTPRAQFIPYDPSIARRGLTETLAADTLRSSTRCALRDLAVVLGTPAKSEKPSPAPSRLFSVAELTALLEGPDPERLITPRNAVSISEGITK